MKKIFIISFLTGVLSSQLFAFDFTSFLAKKYPPTVATTSPSALNKLYQEHKYIHPIHKKEIEDFERIKRLVAGLYIENKNLIFEYERLNKLVYNYIQIKYSRTLDKEQ